MTEKELVEKSAGAAGDLCHKHLEELATEIRRAAYPNRPFSHHESWQCARAAYNYLRPYIPNKIPTAETTEVLISRLAAARWHDLQHYSAIHEGTAIVDWDDAKPEERDVFHEMASWFVTNYRSLSQRPS